MAYVVSALFCAIFAAACGAGDLIESDVSASHFEGESTRQVIYLQDERIDQVYPLSFDGTVKASNINGSIKVSTWESPQVRLVAVKTAGNPEILDIADILVESTGSAFSVKVDYKNKGERNYEEFRKADDLKVEFELTVPRTANLVGITTVNGNVAIDSADGNAKASTVNGTVRAKNLSGNAQLTTVNGTVEADFDQLLQGSEIKLTTVNGQVSLTLPSDANATIKANSLSGSIKNDFGLPVRKGEFVGRDMHGVLGSGDVQIKMSSVSGSLTVRRADDGRQANPTTNLLKMKNEGENY